MTAFTDLDGEVLSEVPGADAVLIQRSFRRAARRFCAETEVLRTTTATPLDLVADQAEYTIPAVANREIVRIVRGGLLWGSQTYPTHRTEDQLDREERQGQTPSRYFLPDTEAEAARLGMLTTPWRILTGSPPVFYYQPQPNTVRLVPIPNVAMTQQLTITYALKPAREATEVDDFIVENWYETLVHGAIGELLSIKQKPWSNIKLAKDYIAMFDDGIADIVGDRVGGFGDNDYAVGRVRAYP